MIIYFKGHDLNVSINRIEGESGEWRDSNGTGRPDIADTFEIESVELTDGSQTVDILGFITECGLLTELEQEVERHIY